VYIYALIHPETGEARYIGKSVAPKLRLQSHITNARNGKNSYKYSWIKSLLEGNLKPALIILEITDEENWQQAEQKWISCFSKIGNLTNLTKGGDKPPNWKNRKQSAEHIRKRVEARKRKGNYKHSKETIEKISRNRKGKNMGNTHTKGRTLTEEHKQKLREKLSGENGPNYGKKMLKHVRQKLIEVNTGRRFTKEHKRKISEGNKGKKLSKEHIERLREANTGRVHSKETRQKLSNIQKTKWKDPEYRDKMLKAMEKAKQNNLPS
jgi:hypothetical protein